MPLGLARNANIYFANWACCFRIINLIRLIQLQESRALSNGTVVSREVIQKFPPILSGLPVNDATR